MRRALLLVALLGAARVVAAQAPIVDSIAIVTDDIFAADESSNVLFDLANLLHVKTRTSIVRRELLFRAGEPYDADAVAETGRNLRALRIFRDVTIDSLRVNGRLVVRVHTSDGWSTSLNVGGGSTGNQFTWNLGLVESNLLGTATRVGVDYRKEVDRTAWRLSGTVPRLGASRVRLDGFYDALSDGSRWRANGGVPFRAYEDRMSVVVAADGGNHRRLVYRDGVLDQSWWYRADGVHAVGALAVRRSGTGYLRLGVGAQVRHHELVFQPDTSVPPAVTPDSVFGAVGIVADWLVARYQVVRHFNGFGREEDLDLSTGLAGGLWAAPAAFGYGEDGIGFEAHARTGVPFGPNFMRLEARASGRLIAGGIDTATVVGTLTVGLRPLPRQSTVLYVRAGAEQRPVPSREFELGGRQGGPRAFQAYSFTGDRMLWGTLEHRWFITDDLFHLMGIGLASFVDWGGAWYHDEAPRRGGDVGLGVRFGPSRASGLNVGRFDVAWRFGDGVGTDRWVLSFGNAYTF